VCCLTEHVGDDACVPVDRLLVVLLAQLGWLAFLADEGRRLLDLAFARFVGAADGFASPAFTELARLPRSQWRPSPGRHVPGVLGDAFHFVGSQLRRKSALPMARRRGATRALAGQCRRRESSVGLSDDSHVRLGCFPPLRKGLARVLIRNRGCMSTSSPCFQLAGVPPCALRSVGASRSPATPRRSCGRLSSDRP
jgi:hypothetical protein